eukprot:CAMPEP_0206608142 /NCGR_PEP_ID=MMETSP0325_2-20121206/52751_1 /ASSEMBLY_ACC=CAM_ASM_000347 /TAXON_ID=2866 /ORGANISM="Crypthecodinium cohnii, Strain Seligo" /LENGTH=94 /DNA_ID=CAMNT_0054125653 /DNA_START=631 /DNA_END=915 /DNA_ORIENTATION=+
MYKLWCLRVHVGQGRTDIPCQMHSVREARPIWTGLHKNVQPRALNQFHDQCQFESARDDASAIEKDDVGVSEPPQHPQLVCNRRNIRDVLTWQV